MYPPDANNCIDSETWLEKQEEYGCHTLRTKNLKEKICIYCDQRKPASLEELSFSVILENEELFKIIDSALCHLPQRICWLIGRALDANLLSQAWKLVDFVSEYGETRTSWFDVDESKSVILSKFRLYCEVNQILKPYMTSGSAGIDKILHYLSNVDSTYEDFWSEMTSAMTKWKAEAESEELGPLETKICADENNVVLIKATELSTDILLTRDEYESMKKLQKLNKTFACPVVFKPTVIGLSDLKSHEIPHLLDDFDPEVILEVDIRKTAWSGSDIDDLGRVLSTCKNLSAIYLQQTATFDGVLEDVTPAVSILLSQHHQLEGIGLLGLNLSGTLARCPLPPVEKLEFCLCALTEEDLNFMANRSDLALKSLIIVSSFVFQVHFPSLSILIQNQAKSLKNLALEYPSVSPTEICRLLRIMAKFNKLQAFGLIYTGEIDFVVIEKLIVDFMAIHSARKFFIHNPTSSENGSENEAERNHLNDVVKELCKANRRPPIELLFQI